MVDGLYSVQQACEASGAGLTAVKRWKRQYLAELAGKPLPNAQALTPEQREIQQLKQRIRHSRVAANILNRESDAERPGQKWVGDIPYLWTATGWVYLAVVPGLFSRKVVGWCLSGAPSARLVLAALNQAATLRRIAPGDALLSHSDQGCQYTSHAYQDRLAALGIQASMSRRGNCRDNAVMERFFRSLKVESISRDRYQTPEGIGWAVNKYIHFYNTRRIHSAVGGLSPNQAEQRFLKQA